jgi:hypothetical protein
LEKVLELSDKFPYFVDHVNYIGKDKEGAPVIVSVSKDQRNKDDHYATIIRNKAHDLFGYMKSSNFNKVIKKVFLISPDKYKGITFKAIRDVEQDLANFEMTQVLPMGVTGN